MDNHIPISVGILTFNSEGVLRRALESVRACADIIVCDGGSTDATRAIAREFGARIIDQDAQHKNLDGTISNFSGVRNQMLAITKYDWFLFIDSDEYLSLEALEELRVISDTIPSETDVRAYWMPRKRVYQNRIVECTTTYPNYQMRFFHKSGVTKFIKEVHERIEVRKETKIGYLKHCEYVPFEFTRDAWRKKLNYYLEIERVRHQNISFMNWLQYIVWRVSKLTLLYGFRFVRMALLCHGTRMPLWYEMMQHWYNWRLVLVTGRKYFSKRILTTSQIF